jgi:site-specific DNA-methyltransferase (adenine-specific)
LVHDGSDEVVGLFPDARSAGNYNGKQTDKRNSVNYLPNQTTPGWGYADTGSAARFFYAAKASRADRNEGLDDPGPQFTHGATLRKIENTRTTGNGHPCVKPTSLMRYLCRLITPPGGIILDPFMGSGSTGKAALMEGFRFAGIEQDPDYFAIAQARIAAVTQGTLL